MQSRSHKARIQNETNMKFLKMFPHQQEINVCSNKALSGVSLSWDQQTQYLHERDSCFETEPKVFWAKEA